MLHLSTKLEYQTDFLLEGSTQTFSKYRPEVPECPLRELCPLLSKAAICVASSRKRIFSQGLRPSHSMCRAQKLRKTEKANFMIRKYVWGNIPHKGSAMEYHSILSKNIAYHPYFTDGNTEAQRSYLAFSPGHKAYDVTEGGAELRSL